MPKQPIQTLQELEHYLYSNSASFFEICNEISTISLQVSYFDPETSKLFKTKSAIITPEMKSRFNLPCPYRECIGGGFFIGDIISEMLRDKISDRQGLLTCTGWQDSSRVSKNRCLVKIEYHLSATYIACYESQFQIKK